MTTEQLKQYCAYIPEEKSVGYELNKQYFKDIESWALEHCPSYVRMYIQDVLSNSIWGTVAVFIFEDEKDVFWFHLRWD